MARPANQIIDLTPDAPLPAGRIIEQHNQGIALLEQQETHVRAVAAQLGYQLPADSVDPDLIQRDISANMRRSVEACLEVGRGLIVLKAACGHGNFISRLDVIGLDVNVAGKFMNASRKFSNSSTSMNLTKAIGSQSKLFEMLVLDDEQIEGLELTGQTGELKLDDIATMSVKELRAKLREARDDLAAKERNMADKNNKIDELTELLDRTRHQINKMPPVEIGEAIRAKGAEMFGKAETELRALKPAFDALRKHSEEHGIAHDDFMIGLIAQLQFTLNQLRGEFDLDVAPAMGNAPDWLRDGADQEADTAIRTAMAQNGWVQNEHGQMVPAGE